MHRLRVLHSQGDFAIELFDGLLPTIIGATSVFRNRVLVQALCAYAIVAFAGDSGVFVGVVCGVTTVYLT